MACVGDDFVLSVRGTVIVGIFMPDGSMLMLHEYVRFGLLCVILITAAICDWRTGRIPNRLTLAGVLLGLTWSGMVAFFESGLASVGQGLGQSGLGLLCGFVPMAMIFFAGGMGGGDVKLAAAVGAITASWEGALAALVYAFAVALIMALGIMIRHRIVGRTLMRVFSAMLSLSVKVKPVMHQDSPPVPFAVALCIGGIISGLEFVLHLPMPWG